MPKKRFDTGPGPSQRALRVGELVRHAMAEVLTRGDLIDDVVTAHVITIPEVRMSPDLKLATIYVMPLGGKDEKAVVEALQRHRRFLRGEVSRRLSIKFMPELRFRLDESFDEAARIDSLLHSSRVQADLVSRRDTDADDADLEDPNSPPDARSPKKDDDETP
ncbi:30S ribosome-binding factor RbfA [Chelatococcus asaccharovorans]|uniref:Ribosome-binding factor A n=1 Tax=Chelatococcus asaccharovorans TaxID=28210 RepID=A0A2V3U7B1_9HYPH|nr:30S ribosome-binding factor RbfA [Chelatococcus asaccharovorans]MBS7705966.1 30S ribosome-binding factor RbfA [Chelatococcus asaccharovorans]PXW58987.1 ribosome-binding factor A [Chelatococcus asaccharovorans]CAH1659146.1 Ribosome-binding factor A [Chelatococcus asaccharovorans]CAH1684281.1 Ribosome-binding factor A [Chelatococcus asaccharovorans]